MCFNLGNSAARKYGVFIYISSQVLYQENLHLLGKKKTKTLPLSILSLQVYGEGIEDQDKLIQFLLM